MLENNHGHIVSIASCAGLSGTCGLSDYCASKFGAVGFLESLHMEFKAMKKNVYTTVVCPYFTNTELATGVQIRYGAKSSTHFIIRKPSFDLSLHFLNFPRNLRFS